MSASTTQASPASSLETEIKTVTAVSAGIAAAIPGAGPLAGLAIGGAGAIADLIVHLTAMYGTKTITEAQLVAIVKVTVSNYDKAVADWNAATPVTPTA